MGSLDNQLVQHVVDETARRCLAIAESVAKAYPFDSASVKTGDWKKGAGASDVAARIRAEFHITTKGMDCD